MATFEVVNLEMKSTIVVVYSTPLKVGEWSCSLELMVVPLDNHLVILGHEFFKISKVVHMPHENYLMFLDGIISCDVTMMTKRRLG